MSISVVRTYSGQVVDVKLKNNYKNKIYNIKIYFHDFKCYGSTYL